MTLPPGTSQVNLQVVNAFGLGGVEFDDLIAAYYGGINPVEHPLPDPSFEMGGYWTDWSNSAGSAGRTDESSRPHGGSYVMHLENNHLATGYAASQPIAITGGKIYRFQLYARQGQMANANGISYRLAFYKSGGLSQRITSARWAKPSPAAWATAEGWILYDGVAIAPADAVSVTLEISADQLDGYAFFDDVTFAELDPGSTTYRSAYGLAGQPIAIRVVSSPADPNDGLYFMHTDHLGSVTAMSNGAGQLVGNIVRFDPFGNYRPGSGPTDITDRGFTGHRHNDSIGLVYMNARYYIQSIGRFASADSVVPDPADPQAFNRFSYVLNQPINYVDPTGHGYCDGPDGLCNNTSSGSPPIRPTPPPRSPKLPKKCIDENLCLPPLGLNATGLKAWLGLIAIEATPGGWWGNELDAREALIILINHEFAYDIYQSPVRDVVINQYREYCKGGPWSARCFNSFWGYSQVIREPAVANYRNYGGRSSDHIQYITSLANEILRWRARAVNPYLMHYGNAFNDDTAARLYADYQNGITTYATYVNIAAYKEDSAGNFILDENGNKIIESVFVVQTSAQWDCTHTLQDWKYGICTVK